MNEYDDSKKWVHYLTRPFNLFGASLWQAWYESQYFERLFGRKLTDVLCIEESRYQVRQYRIKKQLVYFGLKLFFLLIFNRRKVFREMLEEAVNINQQAIQALEEGPSYFSSLEESVDFVLKLAFYGTLLPNFPALLLGRIPRGELGELIVKLRATSYYPRFTKEIVIPLAVERLESLGVKRPSESLDVITLKSLLMGDVSSVESRKRAREKREYFIYQQIGEIESVSWTSDPWKIISRLEPKLSSHGASQIKGQTAFPGHAHGLVKIVIDYDSAKNEFEEGNILVAASTNPTMLPLMKKAKAIVADEGGITSHAAIVSRELKIPCVIGTKIATRVFKDGDLVEVDAERGVVRRLS